MNHQDWKPVIIRSKKSSNRSTTSNKPNHKTKSKDGDEIPTKKTLPKNFGQKMQQARASRGWSQKELAQKMNCKVSEIQAYEQNKVTNPNRGFARKIERVLGAKLF